MSIKFLTPYGPYPSNSIVTLDAATEAALVAEKLATTNTAGGLVYQAASSKSDPVPVVHDRATQQLRGIDNLPVLRTDSHVGADALLGPVEFAAPIVSALDTNTAAIVVSSAVVGREVVIDTTLITADPTTQIYIALNCDDAVEGLVACQSANQRDHQITLGERVKLSSPVQIASVSVSPDKALVANTYQIDIIFGG